MADEQVYLDYTINLTDKDLVATLQAAFPLVHTPRNTPGGEWVTPKTAVLQSERGTIYGAPSLAAERYSAPVIATGQKAEGNCITSPWITNTTQTNYPIDQDQSTGTAKKFVGSAILELLEHKFIWRGRFAYVGANAGTGEAIQQPRWADGFEQPENGEHGTAGGAALRFSRGASRHADGFGMAIRGTEGVKTHTITESGGTAAGGSWERFYIRPVTLPSGNVTFWRTKGSVSPACGVQLQLNSTGRLVLLDTKAAGTTTVIATQTDALALNTWYRVDVLFTYGSAASLLLFVNGVEKFNVVSFANDGIGTAAQVHLQTEMGAPSGTASRNLGLDVDDWTNATRPTAFTGVDFKNGTRVRAISATGFNASTGAWAGDWRAALQRPVIDETADLQSTTNADVLALDTDAEFIIDHERGAIGCIGFVVGIYSSRATAGNGSVGYAIAGGAEVTEAMTESASIRWNWSMYRPSGLITPNDVTPLILWHVKAANTNNGTVAGFVASAAIIGVWGKEDITATSGGTIPDAPPGHTGVHNSAYPSTAWARKGVRPLSSVIVFSGQYTGNDVGQTLTFRMPINWLYIRHVNNSRTGSSWWTSMVAAHLNFEETPRPAGMVFARVDPTFIPPITESGEDQGASYILELTGDTADINQNGETYEYIAFSDAGMRFMLNDVASWDQGTTSRSKNLVNANYTPKVGFAHQEVSNGSSAVAQFMKGVSDTAGNVQGLGATAPIDGLSVSAGTFQTRSALHITGQQQIALNFWRDDDHSGDPGIPNVVWLGSYTGNGVSPRTIDCDTESTVRPLFAIVKPKNAASVYRDPQHTGTTSTTVSASINAANGIRGGGIGQLIVGSDLNANGVTYDFFVICGGDVAGNGGFSVDGEFENVEPAVPEDTEPFGEDGPGDDVDWDDIEGTPESDGDSQGDDLGTGCIAASTQVCNRALSHIGITNKIVNLDTEETAEADQCRLIYADEVDAVLRGFPWPWATKYAELVLVDGTAEDGVNDDWQFSYRRPSDCVFARRILDGAELRRKANPAPEPFREGQDEGQKLIYANKENAVLEYTVRPSCAATQGDALFRDALSWRIAAMLAPGLSRNKATAEDCLKVYEMRIAEAKRLAANEQQFPDDGNPDAEWIRGRA